MSFFQHSTDPEVATMALTVEFFPDMAQFEGSLEDEFVEENNPSHWELVKIGTFKLRLDRIQLRREARFKYNVKPSVDTTNAISTTTPTDSNPPVNSTTFSNSISTGAGTYYIFRLNLIPLPQLVGLANDVFGFNGWSTHIIEVVPVEEDFDEENSAYSGKFKCSICLVLKDGYTVEAEGIGTAFNMPLKHLFYSKCKKEAVTDSIKNALHKMVKV